MIQKQIQVATWLQTSILLFLAMVLAGLIFLIDLLIPLGIAIGVVYSIVILYGWLLPGQLSSVYTAFFCSALIIAGFVFSSEVESIKHAPHINRIISFVIVWVCAALVALAKGSFENLKKVNDTLEDRVKQRTQELVESEAELSKSEELYRHLYEYANELYVNIYPSNSAIIKCNHTLCRKLGYKKEELIGQPVFKLYHPNYRERGGAALEMLKKEGEVRNVGLVLCTKSGEKIDVLFNASMVRDKDGSILYSRASWLDITEIKRAEIELKKLSSAIAEIRDYAILMLDLEGNIMNWNAGGPYKEGYNSLELVGENFEIFYTLKDRRAGKPVKLIKDAIKDGRVEDEGWFVRKNGSAFWGGAIITTVIDDEGNATGFIKVVRSLEERKEAEVIKEEHKKGLEIEKQLLAKNRELDSFSYSVSHDLRAPLRAITGYAEILEEDYTDLVDDEGKKVIRIIIKNAGKMSRLIDDILSYSKLGRQEIIEQNINMTSLFMEVYEELILNNKNRKIEFCLGNLRDIKGDKTMIAQVVSNLLSNAIKYTRPRSLAKVEVNGISMYGKYVYSVRDNGVGFDMRYKDKLFGVFQRLHKEREFEGTGVGLAIVERVLSHHKGEIWAESEVGKGATFYFTLNS